MEWSKAKDVLLAKEVLYLEPFQFKERTAHSVQAWQDLVNNLMKNYPGKFEKLTSRGAKDHIALLIENHKKKNADELKASGISPEQSGLDTILEEIIERMEANVAEIEKDNEKKKREVAMAKDIRLKAMEALSQTKKRENEDGNINPAKQIRRRSNGSEMIAYLKERAEEEMALRAKVEESKQTQMEMVNEAKRHEDLFNILLHQQKQQQEFQQQQVQLNQEAMKQQQQQFLQIQQSMANQQQQNFQMLMAILQTK